MSCLCGVCYAGASPLASFSNVTDSHLPDGLDGRCMDSAAYDFDADGDIDLILAMEFDANVLLLNNGKGKFSRSGQFPRTRHDSEDILLADFNDDEKMDIVIVSEDDQTNELFINQGGGRFSAQSHRLVIAGTSNAIAGTDLNGDGHPDIIIGNVGPIGVLINNTKGDFKDQSKAWFGEQHYRIQDLELADVDGDGDLDLLSADEVHNRIFINTGNNKFVDETAKRLPQLTDMTREVKTADVDNDGDLDIYYANVSNNPKQAKNRLLLNDGKGYFTEVSQTHLIDNPEQSNFTALFLPLNADDAIDLLVPSYNVDGSNTGMYHAYVNDKKGRFTQQAFKTPFPKGNGFNITAADFNGDGAVDLYLCNRARGRSLFGEKGGKDALLFRDL